MKIVVEKFSQAGWRAGLREAWGPAPGQGGEGPRDRAVNTCLVGLGLRPWEGFP